MIASGASCAPRRWSLPAVATVQRTNSCRGDVYNAVNLLMVVQLYCKQWKFMKNHDNNIFFHFFSDGIFGFRWDLIGYFRRM